jgi:ectoine hydroxylase-related dioxygenase (phytanoyl-CoA dioxygenase family)
MINPGETHLKMALYLDPVDENSGALRLMPGTHYLNDTYAQLAIRNIWLGKDKLPLATREVPSTVVPSQPGDLLIWNYRVLHATAYAGNQRRMLALEFEQAPKLDASKPSTQPDRKRSLQEVWRKLTGI